MSAPLQRAGPAELALISRPVVPERSGASQHALRMFSQTLTPDGLIYILSGHLIFRRYARTGPEPPGTHLLASAERKARA